MAFAKAMSAMKAVKAVKRIRREKAKQWARLHVPLTKREYYALSEAWRIRAVRIAD